MPGLHIDEVGNSDNELINIKIPLSEVNLTAQSTDEEVEAEISAWIAANATDKLDIETISWETYQDNITTAAPVMLVMVGESNSGGQVDIAEATNLEKTENPDVQLLDVVNLDKFYPLHLGVNQNLGHAGLDNTSFGWQNQIGNRMREGTFISSPVYLVETGQGGSLVSSWAEGSVSYNKFIQRMDAALSLIQQATGKTPIIYYLYTHGINDALAGNTAVQVKPLILGLLNRILTTYGGEKILNPELMNTFVSDPMRHNYKDMFVELESEIPKLKITSSYGASQDDSRHWGYQGMNFIADKMMDNILGLSFVEPDNVAPVATGGNYGLNQDSSRSVNPNVGVVQLLSSDQNQYDVLSAELVLDVQNGTLDLRADGGFTYTPNAGFYGLDSFDYRIYDGELYSNVATITLTVDQVVSSVTTETTAYINRVTGDTTGPATDDNPFIIDEAYVDSIYSTLKAENILPDLEFWISSKAGVRLRLETRLISKSYDLSSSNNDLIVPLDSSSKKAALNASNQFDFDGTDDTFYSSDLIFGVGKTLYVKFFPDTFDGIILSNNGNSDSYVRLVSSTVIRLKTGSASTHIQWTVPELVAGNEYRMFIIRTATGYHLYLNGVDYGEIAYDFPLTLNNIGGYQAAQTIGFDGKIEETGLINQELTVAKMMVL